LGYTPDPDVDAIRIASPAERSISLPGSMTIHAAFGGWKIALSRTLLEEVGGMILLLQ
jgi:hypothetical protein